jgi:hypothetical protein
MSADVVVGPEVEVGLHRPPVTLAEHRPDACDVAPLIGRTARARREPCVDIEEWTAGGTATREKLEPDPNCSDPSATPWRISNRGTGNGASAVPGPSDRDHQREKEIP